MKSSNSIITKLAPLFLVGVVGATRIKGGTSTTLKGQEKRQLYPMSSPTNIALKKPSTASSSKGTSSRAFDGDTSTYWVSTNAGETNEYLQVDLEKEYNIGKVFISWGSGGAKAYDIQVSNDESADDSTVWSTVWSLTDGTLNMGTVESDLGGVSGRHVRMNGRELVAGQSFYQICEIEIEAEPLNDVPSLKPSQGPSLASPLIPSLAPSQGPSQGLDQRDLCFAYLDEIFDLFLFNRAKEEAIKTLVCGVGWGSQFDFSF